MEKEERIEVESGLAGYIVLIFTFIIALFATAFMTKMSGYKEGLNDGAEAAKNACVSVIQSTADILKAHKMTKDLSPNK